MKLIIRVPGQSESGAELRPGVNIVGRSVGNDISISHPSVSSKHCEIMVEGAAISVRDLHSTNGTFINGARIEQRTIEIGETLKLGEVELSMPAVATVAQSAPSQPETDESKAVQGQTTTGRVRLRLTKEQGAPSSNPAAPPRPALEADVPAPPPPRSIPLVPRKPEPSFFQTIPGAFAYPFKENGIYLLFGGTVFLAAADLFSSFSFGGIISLLGVGMTGYVFLFMQSIITTSAAGVDTVPDWPDWDDWWDTAIEPYLIILGLVLFCLAPGYLCIKFGSPKPVWFSVDSVPFGGVRALGIPLLIGGLFYLPMALLAVSMYDSIAAINPMLIFPSIVRVFPRYAVLCVVLAILTGADIGIAAGIEDLAAMPLLSRIIENFLSLYLFVAAMRLLGLLYFTNSKRLAWSF